MDKKLSNKGNEKKTTGTSSLSIKSKRNNASAKDFHDSFLTTVSSESLPKEPTPATSKETAKKKRRLLESRSSSHTQYFRKNRFASDVYDKITSDQYLGIPESISGSSDTFHCLHPEGRLYDEKTLLERNLLKEIDPIAMKTKGMGECPPYVGWKLAKTLEFLVKDPVGSMQTERIVSHLRDFAVLANAGIKINVLDSVCVILDFLIESLPQQPIFRPGIISILENCSKPILLNVNSDIVTHFDSFRNFIGFLGYLLMRVEDDGLFDLVSQALIWHLSAPDSKRGEGAVRLEHTLSASSKVLYQTVVRMLAIATPHRFPAFLDIVFLLACDSIDNCLDLMKENVLENIFYRFNPHFPDKKLPVFEINPDLDSIDLKLGDSTVHMSTTMSVMLVLLLTMKRYIEEHPGFAEELPCPDDYAQRCFIWAYRYECRAREHRHQRITMTIIVNVLLHIFGQRLQTFCVILMQDVLALAVMTEIPPRCTWTDKVNFNPSQQDVQFKKVLINLSVDFLRTCPHNIWMTEHLHWVTGLMYLIDPGLCSLRTKWTPVLFSELRKKVLQAFTITIRKLDHSVSAQYDIIRRVMWYIEWYSESPFELPVLYWCVRVLQTCMYARQSPAREDAVEILFNSHGTIILMHLVNKLMEQKTPPLEKVQLIIGNILRILTSATERRGSISCCVYPELKWPLSVNKLVTKMLNVVLKALQTHAIVSDRWMVSLLNFIWQAVIKRTQYRDAFIANNGVYQLLDLITLTKFPVQCVAMGLIVDIAFAGDAVSQLITWRAGIAANYADPNLVQRGATIATLLAALFKRDCIFKRIRMDENCVLQELDQPLMSKAVRDYIKEPEFKDSSKMTYNRTPICMAAIDIAGSRLSRAYALLHLLSEDLEYKVALADESYNLYKNIELAPEDECILIACSHFLTFKLNEVWNETEIQCQNLVPQDEDILEEFLHIGRGWAKEIQRQQKAVWERAHKKDREQENTLYEFLGRVRLNIALDALREVRCVARSADRNRIAHGLLHEAVHAFHRRSTMSKKLDAPVLRTYSPPLDDQNFGGHNKRVISILPKDKPKQRSEIPPHT